MRKFLLLAFMTSCTFSDRNRFDDFCGDGVVDSGEACDEGAANSNTGTCTLACTVAGCGDGIVSGDEECDAGPMNSDTAPDACRTSCKQARCNDGVIDTGETCDDGESNDDTLADACRTTCVAAGCMDGVVDANEDCDGPEADCRQQTCKFKGCRDGFPDPGEVCDDGDENDHNDCTNGCVLPSCGDGIVHDEGTGTEECDTAGARSNTVADACRLDCSNAGCGDSVTDTGEQCDTGAARSDTAPDACRTTCVLPTCGDSVTDTDEECDAGAANNDTSDCITGCVLASCGDGKQHTTTANTAGANGLEVCDGGANNSLDTTNCSVDCSFRDDIGMLIAVGTDLKLPKVASNTAGSVAVVFESGTPADIRLLLWNAAGSRLTPAEGVVVNTVTAGAQTQAAVAALADGSFLIAWTDASGASPDTSETGVRARRISAAGVFVDAADFMVNTAFPNDQRAPAIAALPDGNAAIFFTDGFKIQRRTLGPTDDANTPAVFVDEAALVVAEFNRDQFLLQAAVLSTGDHAAMWWDPNNCSGVANTCDVMLVRFDAARAQVDTSPVRLSDNQSQNFGPLFAANGSQYLAFWEKQQGILNFDPQAVFAGPTGPPLVANTPPVDPDDRDIAVAADQRGNWYFASGVRNNASVIQLHRTNAELDTSAELPLTLLTITAGGANDIEATSSSLYRSSVIVTAVASVGTSKQILLVVAPPVP